MTRIKPSCERQTAQASGLSTLSESRTESDRTTSVARIPYAAIKPFIAIADGIIITAASLSSSIAYHFFLFLRDPFGNIETYAALGLITAFIYVLNAYHLGFYRIQECFRQEPAYQRVLSSWAFAILILTVILFVLKSSSFVSRGSVICFAALGATGLVLWRRSVKRQLRKSLETGAILGRRAVVLGDVNELAQFGKVDLLVQFGVDEVARVSLPHDSNCRVETLDAVERAIRRVQDADAEEIILAMAWTDSAQLELICNRLRVFPLPVRLLPDRIASKLLACETADRAPFFLIQIQRAPLTVPEKAVKRILDIAIAGAALVVLTPLLALTAIAVKIESNGPIIFRQRRRGFTGKEFVMYKFRTMTVLEDGPRIVQATKYDPRVTRIGRLLRQTSIDELPQLLNVIRGDMSVVGPRPHAVAHDDEYGKLIANYACRLHVKPGITGWAQVNGYRGETPQVEHMAKRTTLDLWYINNWSVALDLQILLRTCFELIRRRNAY